MKVPFLDLAAVWPDIATEVEEAIARVSRSGHYVLGPEVTAFEGAYANYCGAAYCVGVGNGLDALHLGLRALGIGPRDEVIVPSNTYIASWLAVTQCGARPIPVEPNEATHVLDPIRVEEAIGPRTRAIMAVHLYGRPAPMDELIAIARRYDLMVVEDAAQAHGAELRGRRIGAHGDIVAWSFYPSKNLGAFGDGGAVTTNNAGLAEKVRILGNYGSANRYFNDVPGYNSRLDPIQAAVLSVKLKRLDNWNDRRREVAARYRAALQGLPELILPESIHDGKDAWHLYVVRHPRRDDLAKLLAESGVGTLVHYPIPPHLQKAYARDFVGHYYPVAERLANEVLSLPLAPHLGLEAQDAVCAALKKSCAILRMGNRVV